MRHDFWVPRFKYQLVDALSKIYPLDRSKFQRTSRAQLRAIWISRFERTLERRAIDTKPAV